jgi:hypothetical protein
LEEEAARGSLDVAEQADAPVETPELKIPNDVPGITDVRLAGDPQCCPDLAGRDSPSRQRETPHDE